MSQPLERADAPNAVPYDKYSWASEYIAQLEGGNTVSFIAYGRSMEPIIQNGSEVVVEPIPSDDVIACGTIVLVVLLSGEQYLHCVANVTSGGEYLIQGIRGKKPDGVVPRQRIKGRLLSHRPTTGS